MILRKIIKIVTTRCHILRLKCTKFDFGWGSDPDPAGGAHSVPSDPLTRFEGVLLLREGEGMREKGREGEGEEKEERGKEGKEVGKGGGRRGKEGKREGQGGGRKGRGEGCVMAFGGWTPLILIRKDSLESWLLSIQLLLTSLEIPVRSDAPGSNGRPVSLAVSNSGTP